MYPLQMNLLPAHQRYFLYHDRGGRDAPTPHAWVIGNNAANPRQVFSIPLATFDMHGEAAYGKQNFLKTGTTLNGCLPNEVYRLTR